MPEQLFFTMLEISAATGIVITALVLLSPVLKRFYAARWSCLVWLLLSLRLLIPLKLSFPDPVIRIGVPDIFVSQLWQQDMAEAQPQAALTQNGAKAQPQTALTQNGAGAQPQAALTDDEAGAQPQDSYEPSAESLHTEAGAGGSPSKLLPAPSVPFTALWLAGTALFLLYQTAGFYAFKRRISRWNRPVTDKRVLDCIESVCRQMQPMKPVPVYINENISGPMMMGVFRPVLLLPGEDYPDSELAFILRHELIHYKRHHLWFKLLLLIMQAVHWFNPAVYLLAWQANRDLELSCDDEVTRDRTAAERKAYSETILSTIHGVRMRRNALTTYFYGGTKTMKERFRNIFDKRRKHSGFIMVTAILFTLLGTGSLVGFSAENTGSDKKAEKVENLQIDVQDANVIIRPSDDGTFKYDIDSTIHKLTTAQDGSTLIITLESTGKGNTSGMDMDVIYVPDTSYGTVTVNAEQAGVSLPSLDADYEIAGSDSAVSVRVSESFNRNIKLSLEESSGSLVIDPAAGNYTLSLDEEGSAISLPDSFPEYYYQRDYQYTAGNGLAQIDLKLQESAFSVNIENQKAEFPDLIASLEGGEEIKYGPFQLHKGDTWTPEITWDGEADEGIYIALQLTDKGDSFRVGQYQQRGVSSDGYSAMTVKSTGEYWIFVGNNGNAPVKNLQADVTFQYTDKKP